MKEYILNMNKEIKIGGNLYSINYSPETADEILDKIIAWMEHKDHYASAHGEGIMQNDECIIDAPNLIADIVDDILKPKFIKEIE